MNIVHRIRQHDWRGLVLPLLLLAGWALASQLDLANRAILASPAEVVREGANQLLAGTLFTDLGHSVLRYLSGFVAGSLAGITLGCLIGVLPLAERLISPSFNAVRQVAIFAWIPLISVWFGMGESGKIVFIAIAAFYPVTLNTFEGIRSVQQAHFEVARVLAFGRVRTFRLLILPAASPQIITGLQLALIYSWLATLGAEYFLKSGHGIANTMIDGREHFNMALVLFGVLVVGLTGGLITYIAQKLEKQALRWRGSPDR